MASLFMADIKRTNAEEIYCVFDGEQEREREREGLENILAQGEMNSFIKTLLFLRLAQTESLNMIKLLFSLIQFNKKRVNHN